VHSFSREPFRIVQDGRKRDRLDGSMINFNHPSANSITHTVSFSEAYKPDEMVPQDWQYPTPYASSQTISQCLWMWHRHDVVELN